MRLGKKVSHGFVSLYLSFMRSTIAVCLAVSVIDAPSSPESSFATSCPPMRSRTGRASPGMKSQPSRHWIDNRKQMSIRQSRLAEYSLELPSRRGGWRSLSYQNGDVSTLGKLPFSIAKARRIVPHPISHEASRNNGGCRILCRRRKESEEHRAARKTRGESGIEACASEANGDVVSRTL